MIIGIISDAHGNIYGLKKCFALLRKKGAEETFFLGDALNYFSKSKEVLDFLKAEKIKCIKGNHESILLEERHVSPEEEKICSLNLTKQALNEENLAFIKSWQESMELEIDNCKMLMVHASPFNHLEEYIYPDSDLSKFLYLRQEVVFLAHTHIPFIRKIEDKTIVNVGSVGFSRVEGKSIYCATFDTSKRQARILTTDFPLQNLRELEPFDEALNKVLQRGQMKEAA
ncbi:MAG: metallophosphoesterase family protein [Candidatus Omnitrophica bacterium]|nr:metallophosphoesterase family protein [Candidatus Omnitrophota bacterium]